MRRPPVILGGQDMEVEERDPPSPERTLPHKWLSKDARRLYSENDGTEMYLFKMAEEKVRNHALSRTKDGLEVMGLLLGEVFTHQGREYTVVRDVATTDLEATPVSVRFDPEGFESLFTSLESTRFRYVLVGWYHSHPGHGCFLSSTDIATQKGMFDRPYHTALVVDPVRKEMEAFCLRNGEVQRRKFLVYWDEYQNPYYGESVRSRKLSE
ncbi:MAG TPA: Mov34/MPN/PAD-1 family protein [Methanomassiliicoccales archaeon]|nr:Mov34/MPN/PAD-1 family protein [Methanomassiliicoccales archaeon]